MKFKAGEIVINAERPVIATDRVDQFGNQILENTGLRDGRDCILWRGQLYCASLAEKLRDEAVREAAPDLLAALEELLHEYEIQCNGLTEGDEDLDFDNWEEVVLARAAIAKARGAA